MKRIHRRVRTRASLIAEITMLKAQVAQLTTLTQQQADAAEKRYQLIDQFIDPSMNLQGVILQLVESQQNVVKAVRTLQQRVVEEHATTRAAVTQLPKRPRKAAA